MIKKTSPSYRNLKKNTARNHIWENVFKDLCQDRQESLVVSPSYVERLWYYCFEDVLKNFNIIQKYNKHFINRWKRFSKSEYPNKKPKDLKILYLSGPEPQNDLEVILSLGGQIQNVIAIENDVRLYSQALDIARKNYPELKIFNDKLDSFFGFYKGQFDIVYCDFTGPLFSKETKALTTLSLLFENKILSPLSKVVINSCLPDDTEDNIRFLSNYFLHQSKVENSILYDDKMYVDETSFSDPLESSGIFSAEDLDIYIRKNFENAYSAFSTNYLPNLSSIVIPAFVAFNSASVKRHTLCNDQERIEDAINSMEGNGNVKSIDDWANNNGIGLEKVLSPYRYSFESFINNLKKSGKSSLSYYWFQQFEQKKKLLTLRKSLKLYHLLEESFSGYSSVLNDDLLSSIKKVHNSMPDSINQVLFCDISFPYLWVQLAIAHMGGAYHVNSEKHYRFSYTAQERKMFVDIFTLDRCLNLYNWLPFYNTYGEFFETIENQMIVRSCINAIGRQSHDFVPNLFYGSNLIELYSYDHPWANVISIKPRKQL